MTHPPADDAGTPKPIKASHPPAPPPLSEAHERTAKNYWPARDDDGRLFFVTGIPKSGTTWLQMLLNAHPAIACRSEDEFEFLRRGIEPVLARYNQKIQRFDETTAGQGACLFTTDDAAALMRFLILHSLGQRLDHDGVQRAGAKDNNMCEHLAFYTALMPRARFIVVLRDPRDVAISSWFHNCRLNSNFAESYPGGLEKWAVHVGQIWCESLRRCLQTAESQSKRFHFLRYEDLYQEPKSTFFDLLCFLGLPVVEAEVRDALSATEFSRLSGGRATGKADPKSFFRKGEPGDWQTYLSLDTAAAVLEAGHPFTMRFGYHV